MINTYNLTECLNNVKSWFAIEKYSTKKCSFHLDKTKIHDPMLEMWQLSFLNCYPKTKSKSIFLFCSYSRSSVQRTPISSLEPIFFKGKRVLIFFDITKLFIKKDCFITMNNLFLKKFYIITNRLYVIF